jgi:hypothetical protein
MNRSILCGVVLAAAVSIAPAPSASALPPGGSILPYDVTPEATVRLNSRDYGMYITLNRIIPGILPDIANPNFSISVNVTLFTLDGSVVPPNLPQARIILTRGSVGWLRRGIIRWLQPLTLAPTNAMDSATSVTYAGSSGQSAAWDSAPIRAEIQFLQRGRVVASATARNLRVTLLALP